MSGTTITAYAINKNTGLMTRALGSTTTDSSGNFSLRLRPAPTGPIRLTTDGGSFVSEMNGATITSPTDISALIPAVRGNLSGISINPLSNFVYSLTIGNLIGFQMSFNTAFLSALSTVESFYALTADPAQIVPDYTADAVGTNAGNLGLALGALINEDQDQCPSAPGGLVGSLSADIQDGIFDGMNFGTALPYCGGMLNAIAGTSQFQDALSGLQQLGAITQAFAFGGNGNILTINGVADIAINGSQTYPIQPLAAINSAIAKASPPAVNQFANSQTAVMNTARQNAAAVRLKSGLVLIAGGRQPGTLDSTELYNPATNTFANPQAATMSEARAYATGTLLPDGNVLIAGGTTVLPEALTSSDLYISALNCFAREADTPCGTMAKPPDMNIAHQLATANLLSNGKVLIAGGNNGFGNIPDCDLYDPINNCFAGNAGTPCESTPPPFMKQGRDVAVSALLPNGKVLIAGGLTAADAVATTEIYDSALNCFAGHPGTPCSNATTPTMNTARLLASAITLPSGKVLIVGGFNVSDGVLASTEIYDPINNCFAGNPGTPCAGQTTPTMNIARQEARIVLLPNGKVLVSGGSNPDTALASTELYDPINNCFAGNAGTPCSGQTSPSMNVARQNDAGLLLTNGKVLFAGGGDGFTANNSTDLYTP